MSMLNDTVENAKDAAKSTLDSARSTLESAKGETQHAASNVLSTLKEGVAVAAGTIAVIRSLHLNDALGWIGLSRRRGPFESMAMFGSGVLVGAGLGIIFAPMSGAELRGTLLTRLRGAEKKVEEKAEDLANKAKATVVNAAKDVAEDASNQAGELANKAKGAVDAAERKVKTVTEGAERKAEDLADKAKDVIRNVERKTDEVMVKMPEANSPRTLRPH